MNVYFRLKLGHACAEKWFRKFGFQQSVNSTKICIHFQKLKAGQKKKIEVSMGETLDQ